MKAPIVFLDFETTGLDVDGHGSEPWEFAAIRREGGVEKQWHCFLKHDREQAAKLPESFLEDYRARYDDGSALTAAEFKAWSEPIFAGRPHIVGAVPDFDTASLRQLLGVTRSQSPWHYHLIDIESVMVGYLQAKGITCEVPWDSDRLFELLDLDPFGFIRHMAMGDVMWTMEIWDEIFGDQ